jgi:ribosomal protein S18 acetylase RimI-like enzyme
MPDYPNPSFFLAFCDGEPAGALTCGRHRARFWIWGVFVRKKFRGLGIGEKLVDAALRGRNDVYIDVNLQNPAIKFWRKMGFRPLAESVVMARKGK